MEDPINVTDGWMDQSVTCRISKFRSKVRRKHLKSTKCSAFIKENKKKKHMAGYTATLVAR